MVAPSACAAQGRRHEQRSRPHDSPRCSLCGQDSGFSRDTGFGGQGRSRRQRARTCKSSLRLNLKPAFDQSSPDSLALCGTARRAMVSKWKVLDACREEERHRPGCQIAGVPFLATTSDVTRRGASGATLRRQIARACDRLPRQSDHAGATCRGITSAAASG